MIVEDEVRKMTEHAISEDPSLFLVGVKLKGTTGNQRLLILLDGDQGVTIDQCARVSRLLAAMIEEKNLIPGKYQLEVSSAGLDHPLHMTRQYYKNIGRALKVNLSDGQVLEGKLTGVNDKKIALSVGDRQLEIEFKNIAKTNVIVSFK